MANCINDTCVAVRPAAYLNLRKSPEFEIEFGRLSGSYKYKGSRPSLHGHPRVVDSRSCRQMYLRSYTFSRKESVPEKTKKCIGKVRERIKNRRSRKRSSSSSSSSSSSHSKASKIKNRSFSKRESLRRVSCAALISMFRRLLSCTTKVDVAEPGDA